MFVIEIAGLALGIDNRFAFVERMCKGYIVDKEPLFTVRVSSEKIAEALENADPGVVLEDPEGYTESICLYREICRVLPRYDAFLFHSAAIEYKGRAYLFSAPSGTGKSTHIRLWRRNFGSAIDIINGDKPIVRKNSDGVFCAYGTPWCGKERWQENRSAPVAAVCFLERGEKDEALPMEKRAAADALFGQVIYPTDPVDAMRLLTLADEFLTGTAIYKLRCTPTNEAAFVAFRALTGEKEPPYGV